MPLPTALLLLAALLCSLVAGFLFAFAVVVMPGLRRLDDAMFIRAFQAIDDIIQKNAPLFLIVWLGSAVGVIATAIVGWFTLPPAAAWLTLAATLAYLLGVQLPTIVINIPLNNQLQQRDVYALPSEAISATRQAFEPRWNRWNRVRTIIATLTSTALLWAIALV